MYLKSIELAGFKSFNERTVVQLNDGISCIVGPNGSGKSNIADAVRWVLGEQSARVLRGNKMEDVIFAGTDKLKSLGMAEVVLNIDNSDGTLPVEFSEVTVCRRAYRSGESEYLLNGRLCRLTDIRELFMDSGVSSNSLALIGQGRIQQVVDMKPDERRQLLEEAAGIVKYRTRKRTAERKLADTEQNLTRIWDIISELAARLEPLAAQSAKAEKFLRLKEQADSREINLLLQNLAEDKEKLAKVAAELAAKRDLNAASEAARLQAEAALAETRLAADQAEEALTAARQGLFDLRSAREQAHAEGELLLEKLRTAADGLTREQKELELLLSRDDGYVAEVNRLNEDKERLGDDLAAAEQNIAAKEADFARHRERLDELTAEREEVRQEIFDSSSQLANTKNELAYLGRAEEENAAAANAMRQEQQTVSADSQTCEQDIAAMQAAIDELAAKREQIKAELTAEGEKLDALEVRLVAANEASVAVRMQLNSESSRLKVLTEMSDNKSGLYPGVRSILRAAEQGAAEAAGVSGVVVDLIESDVAYSAALEAAAGANLQNIVVADAKAAKSCVAYLKRENLGRATFLPLADLRLRRQPEVERALGGQGVIGRCSEVIRCADGVRPAIDFIFANILLVDDLDTATRVAREFKQQLRIVTLAGDIIAPGGSITGGSRQKNTGDLLQKKNQLAELKKNVARLTAEGEAKQREAAALEAERAELQASCEALREQEREYELDYLGKVKDIGHLRDAQTDKAAQLERLERSLAENAREQQRLAQRKAELAAEIANWDELSQKASAALHELQAKEQEAAEAADAARGDLEQARLDALAKRQQYQTLEAEVQRLTSAKSNLFEEQAAKQQAIAALRQEQDRLNTELAQKQADEQKLAANIAAAEDSLTRQANAAADLKQQSEAWQQEAAEQARAAAAAMQEIHILEVREARLQAEEEAQSQKLFEGFSLGYEEALPYMDASISRTELARSVKELRGRIAELGPVNVEAIEEYRQVRERHDFLAAQREDLLAARDSLNGIIREMDSIMSKRFKETFAQVNVHFAQTFHRLFGGGTAELLLTEPDDVLTSGVEMLVQPPGKKLINYNLLSGGEKSLIGVALVLAIFQVRPSPFCILDEVDAALDEANVDRFAEYIKAFKDKTQFVVVTHRQGTMEAADRLWGVTMEKNGISRLVSVRLSDDMQQYIS